MCVGEGSLAPQIPFSIKTNVCVATKSAQDKKTAKDTEQLEAAGLARTHGLQLLGGLRGLLVLRGLRCFVQAPPDLAPALRLEHDGPSVLLPDEEGACCHDPFHSFPFLNSLRHRSGYGKDHSDH